MVSLLASHKAHSFTSEGSMASMLVGQCLVIHFVQNTNSSHLEMQGFVWAMPWSAPITSKGDFSWMLAEICGWGTQLADLSFVDSGSFFLMGV